jgi:hypothetical protein
MDGQDAELWETRMDAFMMGVANLHQGRHFDLANPDTMRSPKSSFNNRRLNEPFAWNIQSI